MEDDVKLGDFKDDVKLIDVEVDVKSIFIEVDVKPIVEVDFREQFITNEEFP